MVQRDVMPTSARVKVQRPCRGAVPVMRCNALSSIPCSEWDVMPITGWETRSGGAVSIKGSQNGHGWKGPKGS